MLNAELRARVVREVHSFTKMHRSLKAQGHRKQDQAFPVFESQEDFDLCRPESAGMDFQEFNEFTAEVVKGLIANGIVAKPVTLSYREYSKWLDGRAISPDTRSDYASYLLQQELNT